MNFKELSEKIAAEQLGGAKLTDIKVGVYSLDIDGESINLVSEKKAKYPITLRSLASMRVVADANKLATLKTTKDARESEDVHNLQDSIANEGIILSENTKFNVIGHLKIVDSATEKPVYRNSFYSGYPAYLKAAREANLMAKKTDDEKAARNAAFTAATETLRASGVKTGEGAPKDVPESYLQMPVFKITN